VEAVAPRRPRKSWPSRPLVCAPWRRPERLGTRRGAAGAWDADNIRFVVSLTRAHNAFDALAASMATNMFLAVSTSQSYIYLPWHDEADWQGKRNTYDAIKLLRDAEGKTTLERRLLLSWAKAPIGQGRFHVLGNTHRLGRLLAGLLLKDLLKRMRPLTDNKLHTLMLSHNVTSKFIHSQRTSLPDDTSIAHFHQLDEHIQGAFLQSVDSSLPPNPLRLWAGLIL